MTGTPGSFSPRRRLVAAAGHSSSPEAAATVRAALDDGVPSVRATALGALARLGALDGDALTAGLGDDASEVRVRAAELAPGRLPPRAVAALLADRDPAVVEAAAFALGEYGEPAGSPEVMAALGGVAGAHPDPLCREAAVAAIGAIGSAAGLPYVLAAMADKPAVRRRAVLALAAYEGPEVEATLEAALSDRDWQVRQAAEDLTGHRPAT